MSCSHNVYVNKMYLYCLNEMIEHVILLCEMRTFDKHQDASNLFPLYSLESKKLDL